MINLATLAKSVNDTIEYIYPKTISSIVEYTAEQTVEEKLQELDAAVASVGTTISGEYYNKNQVDDLIYTPITANAYINIGTSASGSSTSCLAEKGETNVSVTVKWACSRSVGSAVPKSVTIDGVAQTVNASEGTATFDGLSANKTYAVVITDQKNSVSKSVSVTFTNKIFYGVKAAPGTIDTAFLNSLNGALKTSKGTTTVSGTAASGQYFWFACPTSYGAPTRFDWGSFTGGFVSAGTVNYTKGSVTTPYYVYRSTNAGLGQNTINIS